MSDIIVDIYFRDNILGIENIEEFEEYRLLMIEEAEYVLTHKQNFIQCDLPYDVKIMRISDLIDFFILEDETVIVNELSSVDDALRIRQILSGGSNLGYLYS